MNAIVLELNKQQCYGCRNCENICSHNAIEMVADEEGFLYPKLNQYLCNRCGLCNEVCPSKPKKTNKSIDVRDSQSVYCVWTKDERDLLRSSSGGVFGVIAKHIISLDGIVFGCCYDSNIRAIHASALSEEDLNKFHGSKYVQSDLSDTFKQVQMYLNENKTVLYSGTPCQIDALKKYLLKDYSDLICIDLICHGVPSPKLFKDFIKHLEKKYKGKIESFNFRNKSKYNSSLGCRYTVSRGKKIRTYLKSWRCVPYIYGFETNILSRPVCYKCQYSRTKRTGDITLGDFWGAEKEFKDIDVSKGVSLCIVNSCKGEKIFRQISNNLNYIKSDIKIAYKDNPNLVHASQSPKERENIYQKLYTGNFSKNVGKYLLPRNYIIYCIASMIPQKVKNMIIKIIKGVM